LEKESFDESNEKLDWVCDCFCSLGLGMEQYGDRRHECLAAAEGVRSCEAIAAGSGLPAGQEDFTAAGLPAGEDLRARRWIREARKTARASGVGVDRAAAKGGLSSRTPRAVRGDKSCDAARGFAVARAKLRAADGSKVVVASGAHA
jgi:hypothetical protein